jgi:hypothetical protein
MEQAFSRPRRKHGRVAVVSMSGLFALLVAILLAPISLAGAGVTGWIVFCIVLGVLWRAQFSGKLGVHNKLGIIARVVEIQHTRDEKETGREIRREATYLRKVDFQAYLSQKGQNRNIAISGMARSGKTYLLYWLISQLSEFRTEDGKIIPLHKVIFQAKDSDRFSEIGGISTLFLSKIVPNVFQDANAFIMAWRLAFSLNNMGITALRIEPKLLDIIKRIRDNPSWEAFNTELQKMLEGEKSNITLEALTTIQNVFRAIAYDENTEQYRKMANMELPKDIVLNFSGLNNFAFTFFAEYLLRQLDTEIEKGEREGTSIIVDEAHIFNREGSIIPRISAVISSRGSLVVSTQQLHTIEGQLKGNCATQFSFKQTEPKDLNVASALSEAYHWILQRLYPYEFVDLAQTDSHKGIYVFQLLNPEIHFTPIIEWKPIMENKTQDSKGEGSSEKAEKKNIDYQTDVLAFLSQAGNISEIGKRFADKYGGNGEDYKKDIKGIPKKLVKLGEINVEPVEYVKFGERQVFKGNTNIYFRKNENPSGLHTYLVNMTADVIYHKGITDFKIMPSGIGTADIESAKYVFEIETGLKNDINDIKNRIDIYKKQSKGTIIIVPNEETKKKYEEKYPSVKVLTLPELWREKL